MEKRITLLSIIFTLIWSSACFSMQGHEGHGSTSTTTDSAQQDETKTFKHALVVDGIRAEFEVMPLISMGLLPIGDVKHHVMVKFFMVDTNRQIMKIQGEMKIINPSGKEAVLPLRNYKGLFVTEFAFVEKGKYGIICSITMDDQDRFFKFWYNHA